MTDRLFFAINLEKEIKNKIQKIVNDFSQFREPVKWELVDKIHLTLLFLGDVRIEHKKELITEVNKISVPCNFSFEIRGTGFFPNIKFPKVIWLGIEHGNELKSLSKLISVVCDGIGLKFDKKDFRPHLTIGRVKDKLSNDFTEFVKNYKFDFFNQEVKSFELIKSILEPRGSKYYVEQKFNLMEK